MGLFKVQHLRKQISEKKKKYKQIKGGKGRKKKKDGKEKKRRDIDIYSGDGGRG